MIPIGKGQKLICGTMDIEDAGTCQGDVYTDNTYERLSLLYSNFIDIRTIQCAIYINFSMYSGNFHSSMLFRRSNIYLVDY